MGSHTLCVAFTVVFAVILSLGRSTAQLASLEATVDGMEITVWNELPGPDGITLHEMTVRYMEENPGNPVRLETILGEELYPRLGEAIAKGSTPDVLLLHWNDGPKLIREGALQPQDFMYGAGEGQIDPGDFRRDLLDRVTADGMRYGVPLDTFGWGLWVNNALFEAAGLDPHNPPADYAEFTEWAMTLTLDAERHHPWDDGFDPGNIVQYGTAGNGEWTTFVSLLYQNGGRYVSADSRSTDVNGDAGVQALQMMYDLIYTFHVAPRPGTLDMWGNFVEGRIAMLAEGSWFNNFLTKEHPDFSFTVWPFPKLGHEPAVSVAAHVFYVSAGVRAEKRTAVQRYIKWMSDNSLQWAESGHVPARLSIQAQLNPEAYSAAVAFQPAFTEHGRYGGPGEIMGEIFSAIGGELNAELLAVLNDEKPVRRGLDEAAERMNRILAQRP